MTTQSPQSLGTGAGIQASDPTATTVQINANGAPPATVQASSTRLNPFIDPRPFQKVNIGGLELPGVLVPFEAGTPEDWSEQKGTDGNFASLTWKGSKLSGTFDLDIQLSNASEYDRALDVRDLLRPKRGVKPPSFTIINGQLNAVGINRVTIDDIKTPKWEKSGNYWSWKFVLREFNPSAPAKTGPADPAKSGGADKPTPEDARASEIRGLLDKVNKL